MKKQNKNLKSMLCGLILPILMFLSCPAIFAQNAAQSSKSDELFDEGMADFASGDNKGAIKAWEKLAKLTPNDAKVFFNLGEVYYESRKYPKSIEAFQKTLQLDPNFDKAQKELNEAITANQAEEVSRKEKEEKSRAKWEAVGKALGQIAAQDQSSSGGQNSTNNSTVGNGEFKVGDRVKVTKSGLEGDEHLQPCTITKGLEVRSYEVRCDPWGGLSYMDYKVFSNWIHPWTGATTAAPTFDCSFNAPAGTAADDAAPSEQLFQRVIYERYASVEKVRLGLQFTTFKMGTPFKNVMTGNGLLKDAVPENAMFYPVKAQYTTCKEGGGDYNYRRVTKENFGCYKNSFGEWMCGTDSTPEFLEQQDVPKKP